MSNPPSTPRLAMIGCGYWGPNLLRNLRSLPGAKLVTVADAAEARRMWVGKQYPGLETRADAEAVLEDPNIDAVVIATPSATHGRLVKDALLAGKDVFVEKPLSLSGAEANELASLAVATGRVLMVGHTFLYNAAVRDLKRRIDGGELGNVYYLYSQRLNLGIVRSDVNVAWNLAPHDVSIGCYLLGQEPDEVSACGVTALQASVEDVVFLTMSFPSGARMNVHVSWLDPRKVRRLTVVGDKKMIVYDDVADEKITIYDKGITKEERVPVEQPTDFARFKMVTRAGDVTIPNLTVPEPLTEECKHFIDCVTHRKRPISDGFEGARVSRVLEAVDKSLAARGAPVKVAPPLAQ
ncbi:MAG: Gfo/Idh/MocA family oxidoreductase [Deltaproteobacteria bacterium]|nr:Gfo/Idh/MocA family oxidoreductase [Deltaproteobacteria bacterium]